MLTIAIAQSTITDDVRRNGEHIRTLIAEAAQSGARLIHFPEAALSGYVGAQIPSWDKVDWDLIHDELCKIQMAAKASKIWVAVGCNHRLTPPNRPHNSLFIFSDTGDLSTRYDKRFCSHTEITSWYSPGRYPRMFSVDGYTFGCALCIEIQFPAVFGEYEAQNADAVLFSAYSDDPMFWTQAQGHAATNNLWISVSSPAQCANGLPGGLIGPNGSVLSRNKRAQPQQIVIATLDKNAPKLMTALQKARPWRRQARQGNIYRPGPKGDERSENPLCF